MHSYSALVKWERGDAIFTDHLSTLFFLDFASRADLLVDRYMDNAVGVMGKADGVWTLDFFHSVRAPAPIPPQ